MELGCGARFARLELSLQISPEVSPARNQPTAESPPLAVVARQRRFNVVSRGQQCVRQALGIERRFGDPGANMWPRDEGGVAEEYRPAEHDARAFQVENRLQYGSLGVGDQRGDLRRKKRVCVGFEHFDYLRPDQWWGYRYTVAVAPSISAHLRQRSHAINRPKPAELAAPRKSTRVAAGL